MEKASHLRLVFGKTNKAIEGIDRESIAHTGLHITDFMILEALLHKGPMPINIIGKKVLLTSGSMTAAVTRLTDKGLIERVQDPLDGRRFFLNLTKTGLKLIRSAYRIHRENLVKLFECLDDDERDEFVRLLKKVGYHAQQMDVN
ncbi:MAG: MarR family transcriptional regulator [Desulfocapsaceae bacterium]|nr:MarR family transcriptional regulator [Desulfocapsaceae bacterium]